MIRSKRPPLRYTATFYVEADNREALEAAVEYVAKRTEIGKVVYACGLRACICRVELEWDGARLTVKSCMKRAAHAVAYRSLRLVRRQSDTAGKIRRI